MPRTYVTPSAATSPTSPSHLACAACPHQWGAHDPIGIRYCTATLDNGLNRGCVCEEVVSLFSQRSR
jgi:hypothetical protein